MFNTLYTCDTCEKREYRSIKGWTMECSCGGSLSDSTANNKGRYDYICPHCGESYKSNSFHHATCSKCGYWGTVCSYDDNGILINAELYKEIQQNKASETKFLMRCYKCDASVSFYTDKQLICSCGESMKPRKLQGSLLTDYRKQKKLTQEKLAYKIGISQNYLSEIERGRKVLPIKAINFINKHMPNIAST